MGEGPDKIQTSYFPHVALIKIVKSHNLTVFLEKLLINHNIYHNSSIKEVSGLNEAINDKILYKLWKTGNR